MNRRIIKDITDFIFVSDIPEKSDVIFIPGSSKWEITELAAQLYNDGFANLVFPAGKYSSSLGYFPNENITNDKYKGNFVTDAEYCKNILKINGVPEDAILTEDKSTNTLENAQFSLEVLLKSNIEIKKAIICCQAFHARRALLSYSSCFPNTEFYVIPSATQGITADNWYMDSKKFKKVFSEVEKCGKYFSGFISPFGKG